MANLPTFHKTTIINITNMKYSRLLYLLTIMLAMIVNQSLLAQEVSKEKAYSKALHFFNEQNRNNTRSFRGIPQLRLANENDDYYIFNDTENGGYVIISGNERAPEILAYSLSGFYDANNVPCNMREWLNDYGEQISYLKSHPDAIIKTRGTTDRENINPLLTCWFNQGKYYNEKCPVIDGKHCPTGCGATAMAQILYYYQWPKRTLIDIPSYITYTNKLEMPSIPVSSIDWNNICDSYGNSVYSNEQIEAISTLLFLCGCSVKMDYDKNESSSSSSNIKIAFAKYFGYDDLMEKIARNNYNNEEWDEIIYDEINNKRPVLYEGHKENYDGHFFVFDGYTNGYFHINWGWGGVESYVLMTSVEGWNDYSSSQYAIVGIEPVDEKSIVRYGILNNNKLSLYYDDKKTQRDGKPIPYIDDYKNYADDITECYIDPSFTNLKMRSFLSLFDGLKKLKHIEGIENLNISNARSLCGMFSECESLEDLDISSFDTENVTNMSSMFYKCISLKKLNCTGLNTDKVKNMSSMFCYCSSIDKIDVTSFNTENVTNMNSMFWGCKNLSNLDVSGFNTSKVINMFGMFLGCKGLSTINVSGFNVNSANNLNNMFNGCSSVHELDLSNFKTDNVKYMDEMFYNCQELKTIYASDLWNTSMVEKSENMFRNCSKLTGGQGTRFNSAHLDVEYARIDEGASKPGYFTYKSSTLDMRPIELDNNKIRWYDLNGNQLKTPHKGINIKVNNSGKTKKVYIK